MLLVNAALLAGAAAAEPIRVLALGDSLTAGFNLPAQDSFPARLEKALRQAGHDVVVQNAGVSGDTSAGGLARLDWALAETPDIAIVELGANDGLRGLEPEQTFANLDAIIGELRRRGVKVLLAGMLAPPNLGRDYVEEYNAVFPRLAARHEGVVLYPFFLDGVALDARLNQADGLHPTAEGVQVIVERILPYLTRLIERPA